MPKNRNSSRNSSSLPHSSALLNRRMICFSFRFPKSICTYFGPNKTSNNFLVATWLGKEYFVCNLSHTASESDPKSLQIRDLGPGAFKTQSFLACGGPMGRRWPPKLEKLLPGGCHHRPWLGHRIQTSSHLGHRCPK